MMSEKLHVMLSRRDDTLAISMPNVSLIPLSYGHSAMGGPDVGKIAAYGNENNLWRLMDWLRAPISVVDWRGEPAWWGYVHGVSLKIGAIEYGLSLDGFANKVAIAYTTEGGVNGLTSYASNAISTAEFGTKEMQFTLSNAGLTEAEQKRDVLLAQLANPLPSIMPRQGQSGLSALIDVRGWFNTLDWQFYTNTDGIVENLVNGEGVQAFGDAAATENVGQSFQAAVAFSVGTVRVYIRKQGSPADNLVVKIYNEAAGVPNALQGTSDTVAGTTMSTEYAWVTFTFLTPVSISATTSYWIVLDRSGANDATNYYVLNVDEGLSYTSGVFKIYDSGGAAWGARATDADALFQVVGVKDTLAIVQDMANNAAQFITSVRLETGLTTSGKTGPVYRPGDATTLAEILNLLSIGTTSDRRLLAKVLYDRTLYIYLEPAYSTLAPAYYMNRKGEIFDKWQNKTLGHTCPVGDWCKLLDVIPSTFNTASLADAGRFFLERNEYNVQTGQNTPYPRLPYDPWDVSAQM